MDSPYRPQSPDLSSYAPQSPDLSGARPQSPDLSGSLSRPHQSPSAFGGTNRFHGMFGPGQVTSHQPTSAPHLSQYPQQQYQLPVKNEDIDEEMPDASSRRGARKGAQQSHRTANGSSSAEQPIKPEGGLSTTDATFGVTLRTSFPVARIKRIMQADEEVGKVAQVTPHVVSRALELFMIRLISASANEARGGAPGGGKGPRRVLAQHMKRAVAADEKFDFLADLMGRVPDAPLKAKKEGGSDSEDGAPKKKKSRKRKGDDDE